MAPIQFGSRRAAHLFAAGGAVVLSAIVGIVGNFLVNRWQWSLAAAFVCLVAVWVGLELASRTPEANSDFFSEQASSVQSSQSRSVYISTGGDFENRGVVAGGDVDMSDRSVRIGTGGIAVAAVIAVLAAGGTIGVAKGSGLDEPRTPKAVHTQFIVRATAPAGVSPQDAIERAVQILRARAQAAGIAAEIMRMDGETIMIDIAGEVTEGPVRQLIATGSIQFRKILGVIHSAEGTSPPAVDHNNVANVSTVRSKVGAEAWAIAENLEGPLDPAAADADALEPFGRLTGAEVAVLDPTMQFNVPTITCAQLSSRPANLVHDPSRRVVACEFGVAKTLLDVAKVLSTDVKSARGERDQSHGVWVVSLDFTDSGQGKWTNLTWEAFNNEGQECDASALGDEGRCRVAILSDHEIVSSPQIQGVLTGTSQITGSFGESEAKLLAGQINLGVLPIGLRIDAFPVVRK